MLANELIADSRLAFIQGKYEESLRLAKQALTEDASNSDAHQCAGNAYMSKADYESAINHYKKAIENDADNGDLLQPRLCLCIGYSKPPSVSAGSPISESKAS